MATQGLKRLQKYLPGGLASALSRHADDAGRLQIAWNSMVSEPLASHTRPVRYAGRVLYVHVDTSAWASRLRQQQQTIVSGLRQAAGLGDLAEIRFRVVPPEAAAQPTPVARPSRLSEIAAAHIERAAEGVSH